MDEYSGYLFTEDPEVALDMCGTNGVRYAAELTDGRGFAAFDTDREGLYFLGTLGEVITASEPDWPDSWPEWARPNAPHKNRPSSLENRFILYPMPGFQSAREEFNLFVLAHNPKAAALVTDAMEFFILVEDGPDWTCDLEPIWDCGVLEYRDARVLVGADPD
jgi:hypothetical protein